MSYPELKEKMRIAKCAVDRATRDNLNEHCHHYLMLLFKCRDELVMNSPGLRIHQL
jgi:hypothetical protein